MSPSFTWQNFDRVARMLESLGYMVAGFGPLIGILMLIFGSPTIRLLAIAVIIGSVLIALYHISFSLLMNAIRTVIRQGDTEAEEPK